MSLFLNIGLCALTILRALTLMLITSASVDLLKAQSDKGSNAERSSPANNYGFSEEAPSGDWSAQTDIDLSQSDDPNVPVVIAGIRSYAGKAKWGKHVMVESVVLKNHTEEAVEAVKFGWIVINDEDRTARRNRDAALTQGFTSFFGVELPAHKVKRVEGVYIDVVKEAMTLIKDGRLSGRFWLRIRISEIRFADGSVWKENVSLAFRQRRFAHARSRAPQLGSIVWVQKEPNPKERVVEKLYAEDSPAVVADVTVSGKTHKLGDRFDRDGDWLLDLSLSLKNVSEKPITFVGLDLDFPETKATGNIMAFPIRFGRNPRARRVVGEAKRLAPDETVNVALSPSEKSDLKTFLEQRHSIASIHKAVVRITEVHFEDGAIWMNGSWLRPDPK